MTEFITAEGNLLEAEVDALVNTVNTVGVMGKGIALQFKRAFPKNFTAYAKACKDELVVPGQMFVFDNGGFQPRWIVNFPTKRHWRSASQLDDIASGLADLRGVIQRHGISSIAVPPLGCGNGGLRWKQVEPMIRDTLADLDVRVHLYAPAGAPAVERMPDSTPVPRLTKHRAALIAIVDRYSPIGASELEIQKLMYFLQSAGEDLKLNYQKGIYGPYADNLRQVLKRHEGHHLQGYGDGTSAVMELTPIKVIGNAATDSASFLESLPDRDLEDRIRRLFDLAEGFETPYGMELLSSVHWCAMNESDTTELEPVTACVLSWNKRKSTMFTEKHIAAAWNHLNSTGWLDRAAAA